MVLTSSVLSYLVGPILVGVFGGNWLDGRFGTKPFMLIIGLLLGLATGVYGLIRLLRKYLGEDHS
ncbi:MAG TPA: AtpZ/AtpI family protein [Bacilli bacterium]|nr:AtpZ/AtpI family protein [Bacilli bacterium]